MRPARRCCVTGSAELTVACAELLLSAGFSIEVVASGSERVRGWARRRGIATLTTPEHLDRNSAGFDYLFSVVNGVILPPRILGLARRLAINYHNGPLPRYAGVHAASWAILNDEPVHGPTWHVMTERIDAGDVLRQALCRVPPRATAWDLNRACHRLALSTLATLLDDLVTGAVRPRPQDLSRRTYFAGSRRPGGGGLIRWDLPAERIDRLVRAHQVGPVVNSFGSATLLLGDPDAGPVGGPDGDPEGGADAVAVVAAVEPLAAAGPARPGVITGMSDADVRVATADGDLLLRELVRWSGDRCPAAELIRGRGFHVGDRLPLPDGRLSSRLQRALADAAAHEQTCAAALAAVTPARSPVSPPAGAMVRCDVVVPAELRRLLAERLGPAWPGPAVAVAILLLLRAASTVRRVSLGLSTAAQRDRTAGLSAFLSAVLPVTVDIDDAAPMSGLLRLVERSIATAARSGVHPHDLAMRRKLGAGAGRRLPAVLLLADGEDLPAPPPAAPLVVAVAGSGRRLRVCSRIGGAPPWHGPGEPRRIGADLLTGLRLVAEPDRRIGPPGPPPRGPVGVAVGAPHAP